MSGPSEDNYWETNVTKSFHFFDEDEELENSKVINSSSNNKIDPKLLSSRNTVNERIKPVTPISSLLSKQCLKRILEIALPKPNKNNNSAAETIRIIFLKQPYSLHTYRNLVDKKELLDAAIKYADADTILTVILFLVKTLKKTIFYKVLLKHPQAVQHYVHYLSLQLSQSEITDLLVFTGHSNIVGITLFKFIVQNTSMQQNLNIKVLQSLYTNHFMSDVAKEKDCQVVKKYLDLSEWQVAVHKDEKIKEVVSQSANKSLEICCKHYWGESEEKLYSPLKLTKQQGISEKQLHSIFLNVKATEKSWDPIIQLFIKQNWIGNKRVINTSLYIESIINKLIEKQAPLEILEMFLSLMEDSQKSLTLAIKHKCHRHVINYYVAQKDRSALINYKMELLPESEDFNYLQNILQNKNQKWKT